MAEVQQHGFDFEKWVRVTFFNEYIGSYSQKWDIAANQADHPDVVGMLKGAPVSVKLIKYKSPIGLGDALRQRRIDEPFVMIVGFWVQRSPFEKWILDIGCIRFSSELWSSLWGGVSAARLMDLDALVKDAATPYLKVREQAKAFKKDLLRDMGCKFVINPKIDSKTQRRVQCSLPFSAFWECLGRPAEKHDNPKLFGVPFPNPIASGSRVFIRTPILES